MQSNTTTSWKLDGMRTLLAQLQRSWEVHDAIIRSAAASESPLPRTHPLCDDIACGECMLMER